MCDCLFISGMSLCVYTNKTLSLLALSLSPCLLLARPSLLCCWFSLFGLTRFQPAGAVSPLFLVRLLVSVSSALRWTSPGIMDSALDRLDAAVFLQIWRHFDMDDNGYIDGKQLDAFFQHTLHKLGLKKKDITEDNVRRLRERFTSAHVAAADGRLHIQELAAMLLPEEENFLLLFRRETPLDNSVEFMRIWRNYDTDSSGYISAVELKGFLQDLFLQHRKSITAEQLDTYTDTMMKMFDKNKDGRLDLNDLARILALKENFLLKFRTDACSLEDRRRDFEKIFAHYDVSQTGALEGPEVDGFVKDMMELVKPSISGTDLDKFRKSLMGHCDINGDGKIQKNELALCLGLKLS
ncbi:secretagogin-like [Parambassis ranga]|uniref:Secretagogin n=1 Tax=Parambassis ranga TaxID=210632 RepID=A0A6P7HWR6_9TELE|nr:secretagogin-like [Parambassis ranga]